MTKSNVSPRSSSRAFYIIGLASVVAAILTHGYLTQTHMNLHYGQNAGEGSICDINATFSCAAASASRFSEFLGVPMALWGLITNAALLVLALLVPISDDTKKDGARSNVLLLSGFIAATSVVMGIISVTQLSQYCPFCILTYLFSFTALLGFWKGLPSGFGGKSQPQLGTLAGTAVAIFAVSMIANQVITKRYVGQGLDFQNTVRAYVDEWNQTRGTTLEVVAPLIKGSTAPAPVMTIVEFADFRCGHCKHAAPVLDAFVKSHPDVQLIFQTWPLDGECNTSIQASSGTSCLLARGFVCAVGKNRGWEAHDWIFARQEQMTSPEAIRKSLETMTTELGLNAAEMKACIDADETKKQVEGQAALGTRLNIKGTPAVFVNGRQLPGGQTLPVLQGVYQSLKAAR